MTITCPHCGASGNLDDSRRPAGVTSIKCPRCTQSFPLPPPASPSIPTSAPEPPPLRQCPDCGGVIEGNGRLCSVCETARQKQNNGGTDSPPPLPLAEKEPFCICSICKGQFSENDVVKFGDKLVCAACKPAYMQMLAMGMTDSSGGGEGTLSRQELEATDYHIDIGGSLTAGWEMFKSNMGIVIGASILVYLAMGVANAIPVLGYVSALFLSGPFMGGLWLFYIKKLRGQEATINDAFSGFTKNFVQLMLVGAVTSLAYTAAIGLGDRKSVV